MVNFVPAVANHFCLNLPATFSQPRTSIISGPSTGGDRCGFVFVIEEAFVQSSFSWRAVLLGSGSPEVKFDGVTSDASQMISLKKCHEKDNLLTMKMVRFLAFYTLSDTES